MGGRRYSLNEIRDAPKLEGKVLPELDDFGLKRKQGQIENRRVLVCFWDMEHCPLCTRYVLQLKERQAALTDKKVFVLLIHASVIEQEKLQAWVRKNNIPFAVGRISAPANQALQRWCVRILPWLILTDSQHVVTAENFTLAELDEKLNSNSRN